MPIHEKCSLMKIPALILILLSPLTTNLYSGAQCCKHFCPQAKHLDIPPLLTLADDEEDYIYQALESNQRQPTSPNTSLKSRVEKARLLAQQNQTILARLQHINMALLHIEDGQISLDIIVELTMIEQELFSQKTSSSGLSEPLTSRDSSRNEA